MEHSNCRSNAAMNVANFFKAFDGDTARFKATAVMPQQ